MDQMQPFCFDLKVNILHSEVVTSVYVCKYSLCIFSLCLLTDFTLLFYSSHTSQEEIHTQYTPPT